MSVDLLGNLRVNSTGGGVVDQSTFTLGTTTESPAGGTYNESAALLNAGTTGAVRMTAYRAFHDNLRDSKGQEFGTATNPFSVKIDPSSFFAALPLQQYGQFSSGSLNAITLDPFGRVKGVSVLTDGQHTAALRGPEGPQISDYGVVVSPSIAPALQCPFVKNISVTAATQLVTNAGGQSLHICSFAVVLAGAESISLVEGTGSTCGTATVGLYGNTSASVAFAANGGSNLVSDRIILPMQVRGDNLCLLKSAANNVSGTLVYGIY